VVQLNGVRTIVLLSPLLLGIAQCSRGPAFPETIDMEGETLSKASAWNRGGMSGVVYVPPGEELPAASLQVGVIVSSEHRTATELHAWIDEQFIGSVDLRLHDSGTGDESCRAGSDGGRLFMTLQVCKTGVARAACVEADEVLADRDFKSCATNYECYQDLCDQRWLVRGEALDLLAADFLEMR
jgi:hypothetical protein